MGNTTVYTFARGAWASIKPSKASYREECAMLQGWGEAFARNGRPVRRYPDALVFEDGTIILVIGVNSLEEAERRLEALLNEDDMDRYFKAGAELATA